MHAATRISLTLLSAAALTGCNSGEIVAQRLDRSIIIDGDPSEWGELIVEVDDLAYDFGYANDDEYLYLCMITDGDAARRQAIAGGVYLWFDPQGGEARVAGIHYPTGIGMPQAAAGSRPDPGERATLQAQFEEQAMTSLTAVELLGPDSTARVELSELEGLEVNSLLTSTSLTLEMRVPLRSLEGADLALGLDPAASEVGLELFVPELTAPARPEGERPGGRGGGGIRGGGGNGGGGRGPGGGRGGNRGADMPQAVEEVSEHFVIPLAQASSVDTETSR